MKAAVTMAISIRHAGEKRSVTLARKCRASKVLQAKDAAAANMNGLDTQQQGSGSAEKDSLSRQEAADILGWERVESGGVERARQRDRFLISNAVCAAVEANRTEDICICLRVYPRTYVSMHLCVCVNMTVCVSGVRSGGLSQKTRRDHTPTAAAWQNLFPIKS